MMLAAIIILAGIAGYAVLMAHGYKKECFEQYKQAQWYHQQAARAANGALYLLEKVQEAGTLMRQNGHEEAAAILVTRLEQGRERLIAMRKGQ